MPATSGRVLTRTHGPSRRSRLLVVSAVAAGALLGAAAPAHAAAQVGTTQDGTTQVGTTQVAAVAPSGATTPSPGGTPTPAQEPGQQPLTARDDTGTDLVVPVIAASAVGLVVLGLLFAGAVTKRQREERRL